MPVGRVVANLECASLPDVTAFYVQTLGFVVVMDQGWIVTLAHPDRPEAQLSLMTHDQTGGVVPVASIEVLDVDAAHRAAIAVGAEIVYALTDEAWGVRRFFVKDPAGHVVNVLAHR